MKVIGRHTVLRENRANGSEVEVGDADTRRDL